MGCVPSAPQLPLPPASVVVPPAPIFAALAPALALVPSAAAAPSAVPAPVTAPAALAAAPATAPGAPAKAHLVNLAGEADVAGKLELTVYKPASDGGSPITQYRIEVFRVKHAREDIAALELAAYTEGKQPVFEKTLQPHLGGLWPFAYPLIARFAGCEPVQPYVCVVRAINAVGEGDELQSDVAWPCKHHHSRPVGKRRHGRGGQRRSRQPLDVLREDDEEAKDGDSVSDRL